MAAPTVRGVGTAHGAVGAVTPELPTGTVAGDLLLMFIETSGEAITATGWTSHISNLDSSLRGLTVLYRVATGTDATTTSDSGDHQVAQIIGIQTGTYDTADPFGTTASAVSTLASNTHSIPGGTTDVDEALVLAAIGWSASSTFSGWTNADLASITERVDGATTAGNDGAVGAASGVKTTAGAFGETTVTASGPGSSATASFSVNPVSVATATLVMMP